MNPLSNKSYNYFFSFYNLVRVILYNTLEIITVFKANSILNSNSFSGANLGRLSRNIIGNSYTIRISFTLRISLSNLLSTSIKYVIHL